jgi:hypothetical protein
MTLEIRIKKLERASPQPYRTVEELSDEELVKVICDGTRLQPEELTDDVLDVIAAGNVVGYTVGKEGQ